MSKQSEVPTFVYKYKSLQTAKNLEHSYDLIVENKIKYSTPDKFNDPFELHVEIRLPESAEEREEKVMQIASNQGRKPEAVRRTMESGGFTEIVEKSLYEQGVLRVRLLSVSANYSDPAMWAYYADNHKGVCIVMTNDVMYQNPHEMTYPDQPPVMIYDSSMKDKMHEVLFCKSNSWLHEKEWRYIVPAEELDETDGIDKLPEDMIVGVILGLRIEKWKHNLIEHWLSTRKGHSKLWAARKAKYKYEIERELIREFG